MGLQNVVKCPVMLKRWIKIQEIGMNGSFLRNLCLYMLEMRSKPTFKNCSESENFTRLLELHEVAASAKRCRAQTG